MLEPNQPAPTFSVDDNHGKSVTLKDFAGRWLLLWWYPAAGTPGCTLQGHSLSKKYESFNALNCEIVGISFNSVEENAAFGENHSFPFRLLSDKDRKAGTAYQVLHDEEKAYATFARRISYLIDPEGNIVSSYEVTDPGGHAEAVLVDLKAGQR